jgi:hypothetical protein
MRAEGRPCRHREGVGAIHPPSGSMHPRKFRSGAPTCRTRVRRLSSPVLHIDRFSPYSSAWPPPGVSQAPQLPPEPGLLLLFRLRHSQNHPPHLRHRRWDQLGIETGSRSPFTGSFLVLCYRAQHRQVGVGQQAKGIMCLCQPSHFLTSYSSRPTSPLAALKLLSMDQRLPAMPDQLVDGRLGRSVSEVVSVFSGIVDAALHQQPASRFRRIRIGEQRTSPIVEPIPFAPRAGPMPALSLYR